MKIGILLIAAAILFFVAAATANADTRKTGDSFNYEFSILTKSPLPPMPAFLLNAIEANAKKPQTFTFRVAIDRVDASGSAHATIATHAQPGGPVGLPSPISDASFEGSVLLDGQIVPTYDAAGVMAASQSAAMNRGKQASTPSPEQKTNMAAYTLANELSFFNDVALGSGRRATFKDGDAWRIIIADKANETVNFSNIGKQSYRGHDVVAIAVTAMQVTAQVSRRTKGTAYYDPQQNMMVGLHSESELDLSGGVFTRIIDINLQP